jgi:oligoribonuclease (3'-5' exoribonuclease)
MSKQRLEELTSIANEILLFRNIDISSIDEIFEETKNEVTYLLEHKFLYYFIRNITVKGAYEEVLKNIEEQIIEGKYYESDEATGTN